MCVFVRVCACVQGIKGDTGPSGAAGAKGEPVLRLIIYSYFFQRETIFVFLLVNIVSQGFQGSPGFPGPPVYIKLPPSSIYSYLCARGKGVVALMSALLRVPRV